MKRNILLFAVLLLVIPLFAQERGERRGGMDEKRRQEFEAQKVAFFTTAMSLTPEESAIFWPLYNEMNKKSWEIRREMMPFKKLPKAGDDQNLTEQEASELLHQMLECDKKLQVIKETYYQKIEKALSAKKLWLMNKADHDFQRMLWERMGRHKEGNKGEEHRE